jgi:hypothetical protein
MVMMSGVMSRLTSVRVTVGYAMILVTVATTLVALGPRVQDTVVSHMSTNLHNLVHGHLGTLIGSAFVTANGPVYVWLPGLFCLLAVAELLWRSSRLVATFLLGHIGATLIVAAGLATAIWLGWKPVSDTRATDVGISYGAVAVLGALTAAMPARWRPAWIGWWLAVAVVVVAAVRDFTSVGHLIALMIGMLLSTRFRSAATWTPIRFVLLVIGVSFGYLVLANAGPLLFLAPLVGLLGAAGAHWAVARWGGWRSRRAPAATTSAAQQPVARA